jgi:hypothetical protein
MSAKKAHPYRYNERSPYLELTDFAAILNKLAIKLRRRH